MDQHLRNAEGNRMIAPLPKIRYRNDAFAEDTVQELPASSLDRMKA